MNKQTFVKIYRWMWRNKFNTLCWAFVVYVGFFGEHSVYNIVQLQKREDMLKTEIAVYRDSIESYQRRIDDVSVDQVELERYAREVLRMHKENEDIYLLEK